MNKYSIHSPYFAKVKEHTQLSHTYSSKKTCHISLDIKGSNIHYKPGDSAAVLPINDSVYVDKILSLLNVSKKLMIEHPRINKPISIKDFLQTKANISKISIPLIRYIFEKQKKLSLKNYLSELLHPEKRAELMEYLHAKELWDLLEEQKCENLEPKKVCSFLTPLMPRYYSISSSQKMFPNELHLTVGSVTYSTSGHKRYGVASHFLCDLIQDKNVKVPFFTQNSNHFCLPDPSCDIIMVGPGVGIAPFRSFLQQRWINKSKGKNWLFFGERQKKYDFYYDDFFLMLEKEGFLDLDLAFSRDQEQKIYVQHKIKDQAKKIWQWLENGAYFYVCGDAKKMAKDVDVALEEIVREEGNFKEEEAKDYIHNLRKIKRYRRDVY